MPASLVSQSVAAKVARADFLILDLNQAGSTLGILALKMFQAVRVENSGELEWETVLALGIENADGL